MSRHSRIVLAQLGIRPCLRGGKTNSDRDDTLHPESSDELGGSSISRIESASLGAARITDAVARPRGVKGKAKRIFGIAVVMEFKNTGLVDTW